MDTDTPTADTTDTAPTAPRPPHRAEPPIGRPGDLTAELIAKIIRLRPLASTAEHQAAIERDRAARRDAATRGYRLLARSRELPEDDDLLSVALEDDAHETPALAVFRRALAWRGDRRRGCVCIVGGPPGVGKTAALAHVTLRHEASAIFAAASELAATPRNGWSSNAAAWSRWLTVPLLAIDDLGAELGETEQIASLLCARYDAGRLTLVTTNLSRSAVATRYLSGDLGARIADRLVRAQGRDGHATGLPWYVWADGVSLRSRAAREALGEHA